MRVSTRVIGQLLLAEGTLTDQQLSDALREQQQTRERLGDILVRRGIDPERIARALSTQLRLPFAPGPLRPERDALGVIDRQIAARLRVVPLSLRDKAMRLAMADPLDISAVDHLQFRTGRRIEPLVATPQAVAEALTAYDTTEIASLLVRIPNAPAVVQTEDELRRASEAPPIVALFDHIMLRAAAARASDVHLEPGLTAMVVRIRVDGLLRELCVLPAHVVPALTSRIKVTAGLDISVRRKPQDGRCTFRCGTQELAARVSTLPSQHGEKIVLRLLGSSQETSTLESIGMSEELLARFRRLLKRTHGVILVTGPTGSGKTSTLYAALAEMDARTRNIVTLEDPVERRLDGITQVQVNRKGGTTFARALRAVLRQDPDIILVGELRDRETVETALAAALTGHLVLSTLHTNDAASAALRLIEMGAPPYLVCGAVIGIIAQRLARRLCPQCGGAGCGHCDKTGFRSRIGIFELLTFSPEIRQLVSRRAPAEAIASAVQAAGSPLLADDAKSKIASQLTTQAEVEPLLLSHD